MRCSGRFPRSPQALSGRAVDEEAAAGGGIGDERTPGQHGQGHGWLASYGVNMGSSWAWTMTASCRRLRQAEAPHEVAGDRDCGGAPTLVGVKGQKVDAYGAPCSGVLCKLPRGGCHGRVRLKNNGPGENSVFGHFYLTRLGSSSSSKYEQVYLSPRRSLSFQNLVADPVQRRDE
jgi:hypothetical protein